MLRKLRAVFLIAATWAITWGVWGALVAAVGHVLDLRFPLPFREFTVWYFVYRSTLVGAVGGGVFAGILGLVYRRRRFADLRTSRLAFWGSLAGLLLPAAGGVVTIEAHGLRFTPDQVLGSALILYMVPGVLTTWGTLALARRSAAAPEAAQIEG